MKSPKFWAVLMILLIMTVSSVTAHNQFRMSFNLASGFAQNPSVEIVQSAFDNSASIFWGPSWEVINDRFGFGMHYLVKFDRLPTALEMPHYDWSLDWMGDFFASFHLFGAGALIDPFLEIGFGNAGRVDIDDSQGYWVEDEYGDWDCICEWQPNHEAVTSMSLFPYVGVGLALDLDGLLVGGRIDYRPLALPVPATQFSDYPLTSFQVGLFGGFAIGGH